MSGANKIYIDNVDYGHAICIEAHKARELILKSLEADIFEKFRVHIFTVTKDG